jgi:lysozyme family protein
MVTLIVIPKGKRPLGSPEHRWEDSIKMNLRKEDARLDWTHLTQDGTSGGLL